MNDYATRESKTNKSNYKSGGGYRIAWIDLLKGFGLICVVIGHSGCPSLLMEIIYLFHMPLFFIISGYLYKDKYNSENTWNYIKKKIKSLLWPYLIFGIVTFFFYGIYARFNSAFVVKEVLSLLYSNYIFEKNYVGVIWFLTALFMTEIIYFLLRKYITSDVLRCTLIIAILCVGLYWSVFTELRLPYHLEIAFVALGFYTIGRHLNTVSIDKDKLNKHKYVEIAILIILIVAFVLLGIMNCHVSDISNVDMLYRRYGIGVLYFLDSAILCCLFVRLFFILTEKLSHFKILSYMGRNSLIIMSLHLMIMNAVSSVFSFVGIAGNWALLTILTICLSCMASYVVNRWFRKIVFI